MSAQAAGAEGPEEAGVTLKGLRLGDIAKATG
jgi:hypothetical protein